MLYLQCSLCLMFLQRLLLSMINDVCATMSFKTLLLIMISHPPCMLDDFLSVQWHHLSSSLLFSMSVPFLLVILEAFLLSGTLLLWLTCSTAFQDAEDLLANMEQGPSDPLQDSLLPVMKALIADSLLKHSVEGVRVSVTYCFSEVLRISAPQEPFNDDQMKV